MSAENHPKNTPSQPATHADYAAADFEPLLAEKEAERIGGEILASHSVIMRAAAVTLSKSKAQLLEGFGMDAGGRDCLMETIENLHETRKFIEGLADMNDKAVTRLLSVACSLVDIEEIEKLS